MLDTLWGNHIALCDAGVGIGKTYAYLAACILQEKYREKSRGISETNCRPAVISTSSIALQEAIMQEYIPFLSRILLEEKLIRIPLKAAVRKGKEHFVCDSRLEQRLLAIRGKRKNEGQRQALLALRTCYDMDQVHGLSGFDRRLVCVPRFCPRNCLGKETCRYHRYMERAKGAGIHFQICNHNYLLADASHRTKGYRPLLSDYRALVVDEAHKLPEAAGQMCGKSLCRDDILELCFLLEKEHQGIRAGRLKLMMKRLFQVIAANHTFEQGQRVAFRQTEECVSTIKESAAFLFEMGRRCRGSVSKWIRDRLEEAGKLLCCFLFPDRKYILFLEQDPQRLPVFCTASREVPAYLQEMLWNQGVPAILTSGTLKAGAGFGRTRQMLGLSEKERKRKPKVEEYVAESPFEYKRNCMLYLPQDGKRLRHGSREEAAWIAEKVRQLTCATHGHTLVLFTSYSLMGSVYQLLRKSLSFPLVEVWRHTQEEIPFAVPDPVREAEKERYRNLREYIDAVAVPDMQKKLRQGFGRAIRTEADTCVVTILDHRAARGGRYYEDVLSALPPCEMAESIEDVGRFIGKRRNIDYYM